MPHPKPAEGNVALISPPEGAVAAAAPAPEVDARWVWFEDEHGERFRVPRSWVQGTPADASNAGGSAEEADPDEAGGIHIKNPTLSRMFEGVRLTSGQASLVPKLQAFLDDDEARIFTTARRRIRSCSSARAAFSPTSCTFSRTPPARTAGTSCSWATPRSSRPSA